MNAEEVLRLVRARYDKVAEARSMATGSCCSPTAGPESPGFAGQHGLYTEGDLESVPKVAVSLSRGCGNPVGFADLRPGETVVDLGCGAGLDAILAARQVSPGGQVIGVDFAPHMVERAKQSIAEAGLEAVVQFKLALLEELPLADHSADVVMSNCVINLCPDKGAVFREAFRVLRPGGRLVVSDVEYSEPPDAAVKTRFESTWAGCVGGAVDEHAYFALVREAGFHSIHVVAKHVLPAAELSEMACCPDPAITPKPASEDLAAVQGKVLSIKYTAVKPS